MRKRRVCAPAWPAVLAMAAFLLCQALLNMELKALIIPESLLVELSRNRWIQTDGERRKQQGNTSSMMCAH